MLFFEYWFLFKFSFICFFPTYTFLMCAYSSSFILANWMILFFLLENLFYSYIWWKIRVIFELKFVIFELSLRLIPKYWKINFLSQIIAKIIENSHVTLNYKRNQNFESNNLLNCILLLILQDFFLVDITRFFFFDNIAK